MYTWSAWSKLSITTIASSPHVKKTKIRTGEDHSLQSRINIQRGATLVSKKQCYTTSFIQELWKNNSFISWISYCKHFYRSIIIVNYFFAWKLIKLFVEIGCMSYLMRVCYYCMVSMFLSLHVIGYVFPMPIETLAKGHDIF